MAGYIIYNIFTNKTKQIAFSQGTLSKPHFSRLFIYPMSKSGHYLPTYLLTYLPTYLPTTYLPTYLPTYLKNVDLLKNQIHLPRF
jgi:hypothetical protein